MSPDGGNPLDFTRDKYQPNSVGPSKSFFEDFRTKRFDDDNVAELLHENTKITGATKQKSERSATRFVADETFSSVVDKTRPEYTGYERASLPEPDDQPGTTTLFSVLDDRRSVREFQSENYLDSKQLSNLLYHSVGVSKRDGERSLRRYPSAGGLYPVELYVYLSAPVGELSTGLYYYVADDHELQRLADETDINELFADGGEFDYTTPELTLFLTAAFWRSYAKYGPRAYRYVLQEAGHLCQNVQLVGTALGLGSVPRSGYVDNRVNEYLGIDGVNEAVTYTTVVGSSNEVKTQ